MTSAERREARRGPSRLRHAPVATPGEPRQAAPMSGSTTNAARVAEPAGGWPRQGRGAHVATRRGRLPARRASTGSASQRPARAVGARRPRSAAARSRPRGAPRASRARCRSAAGRHLGSGAPAPRSGRPRLGPPPGAAAPPARLPRAIRRLASSCCLARAARDSASSRSSSRAGAIASRPRSVGTRMTVAVGARRTIWMDSSPRSTAPEAPAERRRSARAPGCVRPAQPTRVTGPGSVCSAARHRSSSPGWPTPRRRAGRLSSITISARPIMATTSPPSRPARSRRPGHDDQAAGDRPPPASANSRNGRASSRGSDRASATRAIAIRVRPSSAQAFSVTRYSR